MLLNVYPNRGYSFIYGEIVLKLFGIAFILIAFYCYYIARRYSARDIILSIASILSFVVGIALLAADLFSR